jgi:hypothetical protein
MSQKVTPVAVTSSAVAALAHTPTTDGSGVLFVQMKSNKKVSIYAYVGIDSDTYEEMLNAPSVGQYYTSNIKNGANRGAGNKPSIQFSDWPSFADVEAATGLALVVQQQKSKRKRASASKFKHLPSRGDLSW